VVGHPFDVRPRPRSVSCFTLGTADNPIPRRAARVLLIDADGRVLMFHGFDPAHPAETYWFTAGGGMDDSESPGDAAVRELREETGLAVSVEALGEPVWRQCTDYPFDGRWYRQEQVFFVVRVKGWQVSMAGFDADERRSIDTHRWWSVEELARTEEVFYPVELPTLLGEILAA
jgi:8-oxo-dGTP pyrophosphatase MutT (NUDIX family)